MKNLFLNTFADVKGVTLGEAKERITNMAWNVVKNVYCKQNYTSKDLKDAYKVFQGIRLQQVFDTGLLVVEGEEFQFVTA